MLVVFGGLPGVGKTTLSRPVARRLGATWVRVDAVEAAMWRAGIDRDQPTGLASYVVAFAIADAQLTADGSVVIDAVNPVRETRRGWRDLARSRGVALCVVEVVCADPVEHRRRVERRAPTADQATVPTWDDVLTRTYEPWTGERLTIDTTDTGDADDGTDRCVERVMRYATARRHRVTGDVSPGDTARLPNGAP